MQPTEQQIREIADSLNTGFKCFYNHKTGEVKSVVESNKWIGAEDEIWENDLLEIENNRSDYVEFDSISSHDSFKIMAEFAENVDDNNLQHRLLSALQNPKPFKYFKFAIDNSGAYRQRWFDFKSEKLFELVKLQLQKYFSDTFKK